MNRGFNSLPKRAGEVRFDPHKAFEKYMITFFSVVLQIWEKTFPQFIG